MSAKSTQSGEKSAAVPFSYHPEAGAAPVGKQELQERMTHLLATYYSVTPQQASNEQLYNVCAMIVNHLLNDKRNKFIAKMNSQGKKQVYYLSMEFLLGRSLKNNLYNLQLDGEFSDALEEYGIDLSDLYECEPDAGLGNGGLGRLAACYMDGLATVDQPAMGYSICYQYGIFRQRLIDGWQTELPDNWLPGGDVWLTHQHNKSILVRFGGEAEERWDNGYHHVEYKNCTIVKAQPLDMVISGYASEGVSRLRLFKAVGEGVNMDTFNSGDYINALHDNSMAEAISMVLYPNDSHTEGKLLRLKQQYFLCAAAIGDIVKRHLVTYGSLDNFADKVAIHINDTHPTLAIPELMRVLLDDCGYEWDRAWDITARTFAYTNHTVMSEALEQWNEEMFRSLLPRIYQIVVEINRRYCQHLAEQLHYAPDVIARMAPVAYGSVRMANLAVIGSHSVNGVSKLHSQIIKDSVFGDFYHECPEKFTNVTNGIASRRWLCQSNPSLSRLLDQTIGSGWRKDLSQLERFAAFREDGQVLELLSASKRKNKEHLAAYLKKNMGLNLNVDSIFDVQVKRLHEYKRQHLNGLHILYLYHWLKEHPGADVPARTFIFGAKAAPGYYLAKRIIKLLWAISQEVDSDPATRGRLSLVFLEDYRVTLSELLAPAAEVSEQISLAGTEASGTGNMKLMLNGALTLGTRDGANLEIFQAAGEENNFPFGMTSAEVEELRSFGYRPERWYEQDANLRAVVDRLSSGIAGEKFDDIAQMLRTNDHYMALADFESYRSTQQRLGERYRDQRGWQQMALSNIAASGIFCADRAVMEYMTDIWHTRG